MSLPMTPDQILACTNVAALIHRLRATHSDETRVQVIERLGHLRDPRIEHVLQGCLKGDMTPEVALAAIRGLAPLRADGGLEIARKQLEHLINPRAMGAFLKEAGEDPASILIAQISKRSDEALKQLLKALADLYPEALLAVDKWWVGAHWHTRELGAQAIGDLGESLTARDDPEARALLERVWDTLIPMPRDIVEEIRLQALLATWRARSPVRFEVAVEAATDRSFSVRQSAARMLGQGGRPQDFDLVATLLKDTHEEVRREALIAACALDPSQRADLARRMLLDCHASVRPVACRLLAEGSDDREQDAERLEALLADTAPEVPPCALKAIHALVPARGAFLARGALGSRQGPLARAAASILEAHEAPEELVEALLKSLRTTGHETLVPFLEKLQALDPERGPQAISQALRNPDTNALVNLAAMLSDAGGQEVDGPLRQLLQSRHGSVRAVAFNGLRSVYPERADALARAHLDDPTHEVRKAALSALSDTFDLNLIGPLIARTRDEDCEVRRLALLALVRYDDTRVFSELVSSLNDVESEVRDTALSILKGEHGQVPVLASMGADQGPLPLWERVRLKVQRINGWASEIGRELLGKSVVVHQYRQGLGRTHAAPAKSNLVEIEVSDTPVTSGHRHGEQIMMGLALHEIGHHLCDIGVRGHSTMRGIAHSEKIKDIYDILLDERLERTMRSRRPEWGRYFDRLASYAFAQTHHALPVEALARFIGRGLDETIAALDGGELPGVLSAAPGEPHVVLLRDSDMLSIPGAIPPMIGFLWCLRCGFDPRLHPDPKVAEAVEMVPTDFKHFTHADLLALARQIAALLGHQDAPKGERTFTAPDGFGGLSGVMQRMSDANMLPENMIPDAPDIRNTPTPPPQAPSDPDAPRPRGGRTLNLGAAQDFPELPHRKVLSADSAKQQMLIASVRRHVRRLRVYMERLGRRTIEERAARRGARIDTAQARRAAWRPTPDMLVSTREELLVDAYIGLLIDCSGSMSGPRIERARAFAALLAESARGLRGIEGHIHGFDEDTLYVLGDFQRHHIAALEAGGGNNDAGALKIAAELALKSRKRNRLLIMVSDGSPSHCTFASLKGLVARLTHEHQIICAQAAVATMSHIAFPHFVDLSQVELDEAVARFGALLMKLTAPWR